MTDINAQSTAKDSSAFPIFLQEGLSHNSHVDVGLTKREYFAAMALQATVSVGLSTGMASDEDLCKKAVAIADLLINELNK